MSNLVYLPSDEFEGTEPPNLDLAADYLELTAFFADGGQALSQDIVDALEIAASADFEDVDEEMRLREEVASGAITRMISRNRSLGSAYPFEIGDDGDVVTFSVEDLTFGQAAYLLCLVLSNLRAVSPLLASSTVYPSDAEIRDLRQHFQHFATAAIAAEVGGPAWSFGHPRPDGSGFLVKLTEIWDVMKDGRVEPDPSAPSRPKDDQIDIFARREHRDDLPGFLLAAGQVATGRNWREKSLKSHISDVFYQRWFSRQPATRLVPYHVIPFARADDVFRDDVLVLGNVLHRLRVPRRVDEARSLVDRDIQVEAFDRLGVAVDWIRDYSKRAAAIP